MNNLEENIKVGRTETFINALTPEHQSDIRSLSVASISLLSRTGNKTCQCILNGEELKDDDKEDLLEFVWCHVADKDEVIKAFLIYPHNQFVLKNAVYSWALDLDNNKLDEYIIAILTDRENIKNSESETVPEKGHKKK